jgi:hypothetical protein
MTSLERFILFLRISVYNIKIKRTLLLPSENRLKRREAKPFVSLGEISFSPSPIFGRGEKRSKMGRSAESRSSKKLRERATKALKSLARVNLCAGGLADGLDIAARLARRLAV